MFENFTNGSTLILSTMSLLSDLFKYLVFEFGKTSRAHCSFVAVDTPYLKDQVNKVVLFLGGHHGVDFSVVFAPACFRELASRHFGTKNGDEIVENGFSLFLTRSDTRVSRGVVFCNYGFEVNFIAPTSDFLPGVFDDSESFCAHLGLT